jgi:hypothetical protein
MEQITDVKAMQDKALEILNQVDDPTDEDYVLGEMFSAGIPFGKLKPLYKKCAIEGGFIADPAVVKEQLTEAITSLDEVGPFDSYEDFQTVVEELVEEVEGSTEAQAERALKAYCKDSDIEVPKKPKKSKSEGRAPRGKIAEAIVNYCFNNTKSEITRQGLYEAILPTVKGPKNAYDTVNMYFTVAYGIKAGLDFEAAQAAIADMPQLPKPE